MKELSNHSYIDTKDLKSNHRGRPAKMGKLSKVASKKIFKLVTPIDERPKSHFVGKIEIPPFCVDKENAGTTWLPAEDIWALRVEKLGTERSKKLLQEIANKQDSIGNKSFAESVLDLKNHSRPGRICPHPRLKTEGVLEFGADEYCIAVSVSAYLVPGNDEDRKRLEAAGIVPCPSCGSPTHKSHLIRVQGAENDCCHTEYCESVKKCIQSSIEKNGSWFETVVGIPGLSAEGHTRDECRNKLMTMLMDWIAEKKQKGLPIPPPPPPVLRSGTLLIIEKDKPRIQ
jgi:predicted RNase H-like HicB family nuclease